MKSVLEVEKQNCGAQCGAGIAREDFLEEIKYELDSGE